MRPSLLGRIHLWFIKLVTKQVELIKIQLEINKLLKQIQESAQQMCVPTVLVEGDKMAKRKPTKTKRSGNGSKK